MRWSNSLRRLSSATWRSLTERHPEAEVPELLILVGTYTTVAGILNSCRVPIDDWLPRASA
ncbi:hypothetical protein ACFWIQ_11850 [Kitasatospora sp. NPDC127059]|uniref:hypothetical protein n=1 Tax=unclassified Kitasatospora TaxID=2633591 RepID=UPI003669D803